MSGICLEKLGHKDCGTSQGLQVYAQEDGSVDGYCWNCLTYIANPYGTEKKVGDLDLPPPKTEEEIKDSFSENARKRVKNFLVLREIGKTEDIMVSGEEIKEETSKILKKYSDLGDTKEKIDLHRLKDYTESVIYNEKVFKKLETFLK